METMRNLAPRVKLKPDLAKILAAVWYVLDLSKSPLSQYDIVKTIFLADKAHLGKYGRPITFDNYVAMEHGPVPSLIYDLLKDSEKAASKYGIRKKIWKETRSSNGRHKNYEPAEKPDLSVLSESDCDELASALTVVRALDFGQIRRLTHEDQAYVEAWQNAGDKKSYPMSYGLLFSSPDYEAAENVKYMSEHR